jgi:hypothetical protein
MTLEVFQSSKIPAAVHASMRFGNGGVVVHLGGVTQVGEGESGKAKSGKRGSLFIVPACCTSENHSGACIYLSPHCYLPALPFGPTKGGLPDLGPKPPFEKYVTVADLPPLESKAQGNDTSLLKTSRMQVRI